MKKLFLLLFAIGAFASCSKDKDNNSVANIEKTEEQVFENKDKSIDLKPLPLLVGRPLDELTANFKGALTEAGEGSEKGLAGYAPFAGTSLFIAFRGSPNVSSVTLSENDPTKINIKEVGLKLIDSTRKYWGESTTNADFTTSTKLASLDDLIASVNSATDTYYFACSWKIPNNKSILISIKNDGLVWGVTNNEFKTNSTIMSSYHRLE